VLDGSRDGPHQAHGPALPEAGHHREYRYMFRGCPVHFDQRHCAITFHRSQLALPVRQDLASLTEHLRRPVYEMIVQDYDRFSWTARVRELIAGNAAADDSLSAIARELGTHEHTLRRRLADEGYSFIDLKREVKRDLALTCSPAAGGASKKSPSLSDSRKRAHLSSASQTSAANGPWPA
jgi:transposase-like protein